MTDPSSRGMSSLRQRAEALSADRPLPSQEALTLEEAQRMLHDLRVHKIELEMQNEELRQTQAKLDTARARYHDLYEQAPMGYCSVSMKGLILEANPAAAALLGVAREHLVNVPLTHFIYREDQDSFFLLRKQALTPGAARACELRMVKPEGTPFWVKLALLDGLDEQGVPVLRIVLIDISERHYARAALQSSEQFLRAIADNVPGMLGYWSRDLHCLFANKEYHDWFGRTAEQMQGVRLPDLQGPELFKKNEPYVRAVLGGEDQQFERLLAKPNGEIAHTWVQYIAHRVDGQVQGFFSLVTDVTAFKQGQEQLRVSDAALKAVSQGVVITGPDHCILSINDAFAAITGYGEAEMLGQTCRILRGPLTDPRTVDSIRLTLHSEAEFFGEILNYRKDGTLFWNELAISPVRDAQGQLTHFIGVTRDITERKHAQAVLQAALQEKVALLNEVHHRVKNNLQVVTSLLRLESGRSSQPDTRAVLGDMQGRIRSMALLHESLYRSGVFASVELGAYLRQLATQAFRTLAPQNGAVTLQLDLATVNVGMDQATPCGLLVNELIANCLKHGFPENRGGEVRLELKPVQPDADAERGAAQWRLCVSDTGVGLPPDMLTRQGQSLGLQLVADLATQLGSRLEIGPGAAFSVTFSIESPELPAIAAIPAMVS